ncbi:hypothetical protein ASPWEDRAFT_176435 [Aspergillus wentii DTO 134E9]|uniref:DUF7587 domain-containing protein n=1 Tax=Aspergillus wentii DTO 134E9 TaxID=1073089 RepID=A0A1L9R8V6_ASPWE|nr:uncharacterized protein ASPWEDRAFT_176435 [Aspergillus wentii DTO 134E9]KAI9926595.1 hypothetical protein MW887_004364 [Aspergillus wentii]OJJ31355.1 hypothetical protein ASPWEDRAFT_176435 [Aspergillus wentii DTO 134E9]
MIIYRVTDEFSNTHFDEEGIFAGNPDIDVSLFPKGDRQRKRTVYWIKKHLDWYSRVATPFISAYTDYDVAWKEAERRVYAGHGDVVIWTIKMIHEYGIECRDMDRLKNVLGFWIPDKAFHNARSEYLVLHHIPSEAILFGTSLSKRNGSMKERIIEY